MLDPCGGCGVESILNTHNACPSCAPPCPCDACSPSPEVKRRAFLTALPGLALVLDQLGAVDAVDLYAALLVDVKGPETAVSLMRAAKLDGRISHGQWRDLQDLVQLNKGNF